MVELKIGLTNRQLSIMTLQLRILLGITLWLAGVILDVLLLPYVFILIYTGMAFTFFEVTKWLLVKENTAD
jgi:hypothetical protein